MRSILPFSDAMRKRVAEEYNRKKDFVVEFPAFRKIQIFVRLKECKFGVLKRLLDMTKEFASFVHTEIAQTSAAPHRIKKLL